ncbi:MAG: trigger factor [Firmicutes bacterium]|nr:trigger factor [Bacillota bacterium]
MKTVFVKREKNDVMFNMEFSAEEFENAQIKAYQDNKSKFVVDGFRKGKAPRSIIERKFGEGVFFEDALDELFREHYPKALNELNLEVIDSPRAEFSQLKKGEGFTATITVACFPVVEVKDYKGVKIDKIEREVKEDEIDNEIEQLQKRNARMVSVERAAEDGDTVYFDYSGFVGDNQFEGGTAEKQTLKLGSGMFIPGFEEQLVGCKADEDKDVKVTFPKDYHATDLAGKEAVFHCHIHEVREEELPELNDDFAQDVSEFDTLEELRANTRERLEETAKQSCIAQMKDAAMEKVMEANEVEAPVTMVNDEIDRMINEFQQQLMYSGMRLDDYFKYTGTTMQDFREQVRPDAEKSVKTRIVLMGIVEAEKLECTNEEMNAELELMAKQYNTDVDQIKAMIGEANLVYFKKDIQVKKAIDFVYDNCKATKKKASKKAEAKEEAEEK